MRAAFFYARLSHGRKNKPRVCGAWVSVGVWRLAYGHQAGVATGGGGIDRESMLDEQALQRDIGLATVQAVHTDDGTWTGGRLLAQLA